MNKNQNQVAPEPREWIEAHAQVTILAYVEGQLEEAAMVAAGNDFAVGLAQASGFVAGIRKRVKVELVAVKDAEDRGFKSGQALEKAAANQRLAVALNEERQKSEKYGTEAKLRVVTNDPYKDPSFDGRKAAIRDAELLINKIEQSPGGTLEIEFRCEGQPLQKPERWWTVVKVLDGKIAAIRDGGTECPSCKATGIPTGLVKEIGPEA